MLARESAECLSTLEPVVDRWQSDQVAKNYDRTRFNDLAGRLFNWLTHRALAKALSSIPAPITSLIDIPSGTGRFLDLLQGSAQEVIETDVSQAMLQVAKNSDHNQSNVRFMRANIEHLPLGRNEIDVAVCMRFMMHLDADARRAALRELCRVTKRYIIVEYGYTSPWLAFRRRLKRCMHAMLRKQVDFVRAVERREILEDLRESGLRIERSFYTARGLSESVMLVLAM